MHDETGIHVTLKKLGAAWRKKKKEDKYGNLENKSIATYSEGDSRRVLCHKVLLHVKRIPKAKVNGHELATVSGCCVFSRHKRGAWSEHVKETRFCQELGWSEWVGGLRACYFSLHHCEILWKWRQLTPHFSADKGKRYWSNRVMQALSYDSSPGVFHRH